MKNVFFLLFAVVSISCSKHGDVNTEVDNRLQSDILSRVSKLGLDTTGIKINGDTIIVENDIILYRSKLTKTLPRQATAFTAKLQDAPIKVHIDVSFGFFDERNAITGALTTFNSISSAIGVGGVTIQYVSASEADLIIHKVYQTANDACGSAEFPTVVIDGPAFYTKVGAHMYINNYYWSGFSDSQRRLLIAHEFGHAIGIRHTNWRGIGEPASVVVDGQVIGAYTVPGTNNTLGDPDPFSVFDSHNCGNGWFGFTPWDLNAIAYVTNPFIW